jgi:uncharacterized Zn finger protein (UPF0148 family)
MAVKKLSLKSISRRGADIGEDTLELAPGVNILVGEGNTGKTKWLESIDYILGDDPSAEQRDEDDIFKLYDSITAVLTIGEEDFTVERRWKEPGGLNKVYVNGEPSSVKEYCDMILERLGIPLVHYPQGDPYGARKWPELSWRALMRHIYRREGFWTDIADKQPEIDQHACLVQFLGIAERLFSSDYGQLVSKNKRIWELQTQRDQFIGILDQISKELVGANELGVALSPESLAAARQRLHNEEGGLAEKRRQLLEQIRTGIQKRADTNKQTLPDINSISERLVNLEAQYEAVGIAIKRTEARVEEVSTLNQLLSDELAKLERASEAGAVLASLRVTHCPACDQPIDKPSTVDGTCHLCGRRTGVEQVPTATRRLDFEKEQVESEREEAKELLTVLDNDLRKLRGQQHNIREEMARLRVQLRPVRQAAAAVLPPELFLLDVEFGRVQEKGQQLSRIETVLAKRASLAEEILRIQKELADLESAVQKKTSDVDLASLADRLRDGFATYLNRIVALNPKSCLWTGVSVRLAERSFRIRVADSNWKTKLGATQRLYFLFAYHYALMDLVRFGDSRFPGFLMLDFPAKVEDGTTVADKENFILQPFVELSQKKELAGYQVIAAGRSFKDLKGVHRLDFTKLWKE